jgi:general secretion pathway protein L
MAAGLLIRLLDAAANRVAWLGTGDAPSSLAGEGTLAEASAHAHGRRVTIFVPCGELMLTRVAVPSHKPHHMRMAVPYLLEEQLAEEISRLHFAIGTRADDGTVGVAVVTRARLQAWLEAFDNNGITAAAVVPDVLALPHDDDDAWTLAGEEGALLLNCGTQGGMAIDDPQASDLLAAVLAAADPPPVQLRTVGPAAAAAVAALPELERPACSHEDTPLLTLLARGVKKGHDAINLLQGEFAPDAGRRARWATWQRPAALAAALLLLLLGMRIVNLQQLERESAELDAALAATYREAFPEATRVNDPVKQMRQQLAQVGGTEQGRFLDLLAAIGAALERQEKWQVVSVSYRNDTLQVQLKMPAFEHFERLREGFADQPDLLAEIGSLGSVDGEVRGSVTLRRAGS